MSSRASSAPRAASVDLVEGRDGKGRVLVLAKLTHDVSGAGRTLEPEPLLHDFADPRNQPLLRPGTDFWPRKEATDVVLQGSAWAPGRPAAELDVTLQVGRARKSVRVFGRREVRWGAVGPRIGVPEPFTEVPLTWENAYGGIDWRVDPTEEELADPDLSMALIMDVDHPGLYPRNPFGRGYLVEPGPVEGMDMPSLEDPDDLLTDERLVVGDARRWYRQPLPWCFDWAHPAALPRLLYSAPGMDAWYPAPEDETLSEVRRGYLPQGYRTELAARTERGRWPHPRFHQEASAGLVVAEPLAGAPVRVTNAHPERSELAFRIPEHVPAIDVTIAGATTRGATRLHSVVLRPADEVLTLLFAADVECPKKFAPGIHADIPVSARIDGGDPVTLPPVPTLRRSLAEGMAAKADELDGQPPAGPPPLGAPPTDLSD